MLGSGYTWWLVIGLCQFSFLLSYYNWGHQNIRSLMQRNYEMPFLDKDPLCPFTIRKQKFWCVSLNSGGNIYYIWICCLTHLSGDQEVCQFWMNPGTKYVSGTGSSCGTSCLILWSSPSTVIRNICGIYKFWMESQVSSLWRITAKISEDLEEFQVLAL